MNHVSADVLLERLSARARVNRVPESVTFELTYGCNLRCVHCYNPTHRAQPEELTTAEVCALLDQLVEVGVLELHWTGGEPLVRPDALEIFRYAKRRGFILYLLTNATRMSRPVVEALKEIGFYSVTVSLYGATPATYERVTGIPGSYALCLRGLESLAAARLPVVVRMPVMVDNVQEVRAARTLVEGLGFKFQYCLDIMPRTDGDLSPLAHRLSPAEKVRIDSEMLRDGFVKTVDTEPCRAAPDAFIACACGRSQFAITPYGEMNLCAAFPIPKFDLRKGTVKEGWAVLKRTVDEATPNDRYACPTCVARPHCRQGRNDAWLETGDMSACLPHYKEFALLEFDRHGRREP